MKDKMAWYVDDNILIYGLLRKNTTTNDFIFYPKNLSCGWSSQIIKSNEIGKTVLLKLRDVFKAIHNDKMIF